MHTRRTLVGLTATAALALPLVPLATGPATAATTATAAATATDPVNAVYQAEFSKGVITKAATSSLPKTAFGRTTVEPKRLKEVTPRPPEIIQPELQKVLDSGSRRTVEVLVTYPSAVTVPVFPMPEFAQGRDSDANKRHLATSAKLVEGLRAARAGAYREQTAVVEKLGGKVLDSYWLIQGLHAVLPVESVKRLAASGVQYVELGDDVWKPPADANPNNDAEDARAQIASDPYYNLNQTSGWIGLLDTGVRTTHDVFNAPDHLAIVDDVTGDGDPTDQCNHGTASAGLITGNSRLGAAWRGVSAISLDSWDVYGNNCGVSSADAVDGFEEAVRWLDKVIVAEIQISASETGSVSTAADAAFDAGSVVVAANGNYGPAASTVRAPGNAHKALGIGAADLQTDVLEGYSGRGPTTDGRYKPDLVFPTNIETARSASDTDRGSFGGTSAATPVAGGAVALMRNWQRGGFGVLDPGHVYSHAILGGQTLYPFNNNTGAGPFVLGTGGTAWWGKTTVGNFGTVEIPISVAAGRTKFEGSLWWPENTTTHNDVDLALVSPTGVVHDSSTSIVSVFERASVLTGLTPGTWKLRITGFTVSGTQTVYWSARTR